MKRILVIFLTLTMMLWTAAATAQNPVPDFADGNHWASPDIQVAAGLGLMNGTGTDSAGRRLFSPLGTVSRAQLAAILTNTFGLDYGSRRFIKEPLGSDYYRDVNDHAWYAPFVVMGAINEIFPRGGDFRPDRAVTRAEIAQALQRCFDAKGISVPMIMVMPMFHDTAGLSQAEMNAVVFVNNTGIMRGSDGYFRPADSLTRAEMAVVVRRCVELMAAGQQDQDGERQVPLGGILYLRLASNPTTGFVWSVAGGSDGIIKESGSAYRPAPSSAGTVVGQGGHQFWRFQTIQAGSVNLQLVYARPWESVQPQQRFNLRVTVSPSIWPVPTLSTTAVHSQGSYMTVDAHLPVLQGLTQPALQAQLNTGWEQDLQQLEAELSAGLDEYIRYNQEHDFPIRPYELFSRYQCGILNQHLLSLYIDYYRYTGGAHGLTDRRPYNFDLRNGQPLQLADLFQAGYDFRAVIDGEIAARIAADPELYFSGDMGFQGIRSDQDFYLQDGQLVVYFNQYEIAPYASGIPEFTIPWSRFGSGMQSWLLADQAQ